MMVVEYLKQAMSMRRIRLLTGISNSFMYRRNRERKRYSRVPDEIRKRIVSLCSRRITYGYRRIWAALRNEGIVLNVKTVRRIMRENGLSLPAAKHHNRTKTRN